MAGCGHKEDERKGKGRIRSTGDTESSTRQVCDRRPAWGNRQAVVAGAERVVVGGRGNGGMGVQPCKQPSGGDLQGMGYAEQRQYRNIVSPLFNLAHIPVTYTSSGGECRLGEPPLLSVLPESRPKTLQRCVLRT